MKLPFSHQQFIEVFESYNSAVFPIQFIFIVARNHVPRFLLIIPTVWAVIGVSAAIHLHIYQDVMLPVSALMANVSVFSISKK